MEFLQWLKEGIIPLDKEAMARAKRRLDQLTKPRESLGELEKLVIQMAGITGEEMPELGQKVSVIFAADHGVTQEGVSAYPKEVTLQMAQNFIQGGAAINVLAREAKAQIILLDIGMDGDLELEGLRRVKVKYGTNNMVLGPAMTTQEAIASVEVGFQLVQELKERGVSIIGLGEMGIGNTTASSALLAVFSHKPVEDLVGRGTGIEEERLPHKIRVVKRALARNQVRVKDPIDALAKVGGLEIGGMAGVFLGGAIYQIPVIIDGFICAVAALLAARINPLVVDYMIPSHASLEPGHGTAMELLGLKPFLNLGMRLGEGTGAALMMQVVEAACKIQKGMATFEEAQVSNKG